MVAFGFFLLLHWRVGRQAQGGSVPASSRDGMPGWQRHIVNTAAVTKGVIQFEDSVSWLAP